MKRNLDLIRYAMVGAAIGTLVPVPAIGAEGPPGVLQLTPVEPGMCVAVKVPVLPEQAVSGLTWYNNDGDTVFPEVLVAAGYHGVAPNLADAIVLLENVQGTELGESAVDFGADIQSPTGVFYVIFRLPGFAGAQGPGQGPGFGYEEVDEESSVFVKAEGEGWARLITEKRLLVDPVYAESGTAGKSGQAGKRPVLVLAAPTAGSKEEVSGTVGEQDLPARTEMFAPYPNPFNPQVTISYALNEPAEVTIAVYDVRGRKVHEVAAGLKQAGRYEEVWYGRDASGRRQASGVYFVRLKAGAYEQTRRVALLK